ncbi:MAG: hypothetical protein MMC23_000407 [Stictis urceolatum]|nr:hypothetical protein [Stictis urceolata]
MKPSSILLLLSSLAFTSAFPTRHGAWDDAAPNEEARAKAEQGAKHKAQLDYENSKKYFHEPASHEAGADDLLGHYDTRFFKEKLSYEDKRAVQVHMVRAYLETFKEKGIETWIAHGTLLGWWWNGLMLPWDWDIDTQVSESTLFYLGEHLNNTRHNYTMDVDGKSVTTTYLMDVNPYAAERVRGDGFNIIDARWINVENGLYIDITGLSELEPQKNPGVVSCKNNHHYRLGDIYPLRPTSYEGVEASVPYEYAKMLTDEYGDNSLVLTEFEGHRWSQDSREWVQMEKLKKQDKR